MSSIKDYMRKVLKNDFVQGLLITFAMSVAFYLAFIISDFVESF